MRRQRTAVRRHGTGLALAHPPARHGPQENIPMHTSRFPRLLPAAALALLTAVVSAQDKPAKPDAPKPDAPKTAPPMATAKAAPVAPARGSELVGLKVLDASGKTLG